MKQTKPSISLIAAIDSNKAIGTNGKLLCYISEDMKRFKNLTQGHTVIMGRKTFDSLPNGALPHRRNILISRNKFLKAENCEVYQSLAEALAQCNVGEEIFIIGGGEIYAQSMPIADKLYITQIEHRFDEADTFFPSIDHTLWTAESEEIHAVSETNPFAFSFISYRRTFPTDQKH